MKHRIARQTSGVRVVAMLMVGAFMSAATHAQQPIVPLELSIADPGARSMGFGGAFVALGDDATAAFANPAGLVQLLRPEFAIEGRWRKLSETYTRAGRIDGPPTGIGIDTLDGLVQARSHANISGVSFVAVAYPLQKGSLAVFRHEYARHEFDGATQGLFGVGSDCCQPRYVDQRTSSELEFVSYGISGAFRVSDAFSIGLGLVYHDTSLVADVSQYLPDDDTPQSRYRASSYLPDRLILSQRSISSDTDVTLTGGFLWRPSDSWSVGGVYRGGLKTNFRIEMRAGEAVDLGVPPGEIFLSAAARPIEFPDIYGAGVAYRRPNGRLTVSLQWDRVEYSTIPASLELDDQTIDNAHEWRVGAEYVFIDATPVVALRLGAWLDPDHQMRATSDDPYTRALLPRGEDEWHYSAGLGLAMRRFQVDLAVDLGDRLDTMSLSAVYSF